MRSIFFASSVPFGDAWKEVLGAVIICGLLYFADYGIVEAFRRIGFSNDSSVEYAWWMNMIAVALVFGRRGFPSLAVICLAIGAGLQVRGSYGIDPGMGIPEWVIGFFLILRGFSYGPASRS